MARTIHQEEHAARINEILDVTQTLIYTKGYDQMTIRDLIDALQISKGAFYHYFDSKQALLEALIERMVEQMSAVLGPIVDDPETSALPKLQAIFHTATGWKTERVDLVAALARVWYKDDNALVREKLSRVTLGRFGKMLEAVIAQGIAEGAMATDYPDLAGGMTMDLLYSMSNALMRCLMNWGVWPDGPERLRRLIDAYQNGIERVLGITPGSLRLVDAAMLYSWGEVFSRG